MSQETTTDVFTRVILHITFNNNTHALSALGYQQINRMGAKAQVKHLQSRRPHGRVFSFFFFIFIFY